jgi:uncharacterized repeat protein (TIGR01451 family)
MFVALKRLRPQLAGAAFAIVCAFASPALAAGTQAGQSVSNTFTLNYKVGGVSQTAIDNTASPTVFVVDRKVDVTVTSQGDANVSPGATAQSLVYSVQNTGNDNQAYRLTLSDIAGDTFDATGLTLVYYVDDGDGVYEPGAGDGSSIAYTAGVGVTADLAPDRILWVVVTGNIPAGATNGQRDDIALVANSFDPTAWINSASATPGAETTGAAAGTNTAGGVENVLADGAGTADSANQGDHSDTGAFNIASASLSASKTVAVVATNPVNCATDAISGGFATPGACVEYVITATNAAGAAAAATEITIGDVLPNDVAFVASSQTGFTNDPTTGPVSISNPAVGCTTSCTVTLSGAQLAIGATGTLTIRATVR